MINVPVLFDVPSPNVKLPAVELLPDVTVPMTVCAAVKVLLMRSRLRLELENS